MAISEQQAVEVLKFLNLESVESVEEAKEKFQQSWTKNEEVSGKIGRLTGSIANVTRKAFEPFGVVLSEDDFKEKKVEDVIRSASEKAKGEFEKQRAEWEQRASGNGSEELIKEWEKKYKALEKKSAEIDSARQDAMSQFETFKNQVVIDSKKAKVDSAFEKELSAIKLDSSVNEFTLRGFKSALAEKYEIDIEESGNIVVKDRAVGERIKSKDKAGSFLGLSDVLIKEATDAGIIQKNVHSGKPFQRVAQIQSADTTQQNPKQRSVNPRFFGGI